MSVPPSRAAQEMADARRHAAEAEAERVIAEQDAEAEAQAAHEPEPRAPTPHDPPDARAAASRGAQVVLDPDSPEAIAARGGAGKTMHENVAARDAAVAAKP